MESDEQNHRLRTGICISRRSPPCIHAFDTVARQIVRVRETEGGTRRPGAVLNVVLQGRLQVASGCGFIEFRSLAMVTIGICRSKVNFWGSQVDLRGMSGQYIIRHTFLSVFNLSNFTYRAVSSPFALSALVFPILMLTLEKLLYEITVLFQFSTYFYSFPGPGSVEEQRTACTGLNQSCSLPAISMLPPELWRTCISLFVVLLLYPSLSFEAATLDRRVLTPLTEADISQLVSARDPLRNLDPSNSNSHLSKILIPRPRIIL
jgi:hypothetical protein